MWGHQCLMVAQLYYELRHHFPSYCHLNSQGNLSGGGGKVGIQFPSCTSQEPSSQVQRHLSWWVMDCISEQVGSRRELDLETAIWLLQPCALCPAQHQASCHIIQVPTAAEPALVPSPDRPPLRPAEGKFLRVICTGADKQILVWFQSTMSCCLPNCLYIQVCSL